MGFFDKKLIGRVREERKRFRASPSKNYSPSNEAVLKLVSWGKSARAANQTAQYITRTRAQDKGLSLYGEDELGQEITPDRLKEKIRDWELTPNQANMSKQAKALSPEERNKLPEKDRLAERQTGHMILSVPARLNVPHKKLEAITRETLQETFGKRGVRYIFTIHTDHSNRPHAHVLFKARTEEGVKLRLSPEDFQVMRRQFTEIAQGYNVPLQVTQREDRRELAKAISQGKDPLRTGQKRTDYNRQQIFSSTTDGPLWLALRAPTYYTRHGDAYLSAFEQKLARKTGQIIETKNPPKPILTFPPISKATDDRLEARFSGNKIAKGRFLELYAENPPLAVWAANKRPEIFDAEPSEIKLSTKRMGIDPAWKKEAQYLIRTTLIEQPDWQKQHESERVKTQEQRIQKAISALQLAHDQAVLKKAVERYGTNFFDISKKPAIPSPNIAEEPKDSIWRRIFGRADETKKPAIIDKPTLEKPETKPTIQEKEPKQPSRHQIINPPQTAPRQQSHDEPEIEQE